MFSFEHLLDLPLIWYGLIGTAVLLYVILDGFDLGVGILFPFAPSDRCRDRMMNSIAPFWDGNETWLVLGGGGLFAAFPLAYAVLMPAFYLPIIFMLLGLVFRGVAFEFRFKAEGWARKAWDYAFHFGSLCAAFMQGAVLGTFIQGVAVKGRHFAGGALDWISPFSLMTGAALVFGYALLGATWGIMKTDGETQEWSRKCAEYVCVFVAFFMVLVSVTTPFLHERFRTLWLSRPNLFYLAPLPLLTLGMFILLWRDLVKKNEYRPFFVSIGIFLTHYLGLGISLWPWIVPFQFTLWDAAAAPASQSLLLAGTLFLLPLVLGYTAYSFYTFRGKASHEGYY